MTDPNGDATIPPPATPASQDPEYQDYAFTQTIWELPPTPKDVDWFGNEERTIRDAHAYAYQQYGTTYNWARYIHLGYFAYTNCSEFDKIWSRFDEEPLPVHRAIWYNFMYHAERDMPTSEQLNTWALNISHAYIEHYDLPHLNVDTMKFPNGIKKLQENDHPVEPTKQDWIPVTDKKRQTTPKPTQEPTKPSNPPKTGGIL